jgi:hypothetical protein
MEERNNNMEERLLWTISWDSLLFVLCLARIIRLSFDWGAPSLAGLHACLSMARARAGFHLDKHRVSYLVIAGEVHPPHEPTCYLAV